MPGHWWAGSAASFLGTWVVMMAAMMLPSLAPGLWRYREAAGRSGVASPGRLSAIVGVTYLLVWTLVGVAVFPIGAAVAAAEMLLPESTRVVPIAVGAAVLIAGALQLTKWKAHHLACCREAFECRTLPATARTAVRDGASIGIHCSHSCFGFVAILLVFGIMDLRAMTVVTAAITAERLAPSGERVARATGALAVAVGLILIARAGGIA